LTGAVGLDSPFPPARDHAATGIAWTSLPNGF